MERFFPKCGGGFLWIFRFRANSDIFRARNRSRREQAVELLAESDISLEVINKDDDGLPADDENIL